MGKKLIEVALPLEAINREAAREKSIRHGHPSTLHLWWARRPLAACRAVLFSQLVDDPSAHPEEFPTEEAQEAERQRLFRIIEDLVKWENSNNEVVLERARAEIRKSLGEDPPPILDPFAGGGSIPLEAQRLGLKAIASDLNPVAVLINKALIEIPPKWAGRPPVHPSDDGRLDTQTWAGAQGLAEDVRYYGQWMRDEAERRIGHRYPRAALGDGSSAPVIAWIWARTVVCPNPACGGRAPLVRSFWLGKKKGRRAWVEPVVAAGGVRFKVCGPTGAGPTVEGTVGRSGANCLICSESIPLVYIRSEGRGKRLGSQLMAIVAGADRQRVYLSPSEEHEVAANVPRPQGAPSTSLPDQALGFRVQAYGMVRHEDLFTNRQLLAMMVFSDLVAEARERILSDAVSMSEDPAARDTYADAIATYLGLAASRLADLNNSICTWSSSRDQARNLFARQAIPMAWDYVEVCPFAEAAGDLGVSVGSAARVIRELPAVGDGAASQAEASKGNQVTRIVSTDPPYYDNIGYADLSDFFYVWLRRSLGAVYPDLLRTLLTPKSEELIATPYRFGGDRVAAEKHFEDGFVATFSHAREYQPADIPMTIFYAFKQAEREDDAGGISSTGWETMLEGLIQAKLMVTSTWPMRTERAARSVGIGTNALASSVVLSCRPRPTDAGVTDRRGFLKSLRDELPEALREMQQGSIAPVDLAQSAIGPGMAVFSRYARVLEPSGDTMMVRTALMLINQVLDEVLAEQEGDFDADTRWALKWYEQFGFDEGEYGVAETLFTATGTALNGVVQAGIVGSRSGKVWLLKRDEYPDDWDPASDDRTPVWEATQHLVKRLEEGGEQAAADLLRQLGGLGDTAQLLAYRLYAICQDKRPKEAGPYNALVTSWPEISRLASNVSVEIDEQQHLL